MILKLNLNKIKYIKPTNYDKLYKTTKFSVVYECAMFEHLKVFTFNNDAPFAKLAELPETIELYNIQTEAQQ